MNEKCNIMLADCHCDEVKSFAERFFYESQPFTVKSYIANWRRTGKLSEFKRYAKYFLVPLWYFIRRRQYSVIAGWQQFYALIFCFYSSLFHVKKENIVIALNFTYKEKNGKLSALYRWFFTRCMAQEYLDYIHVPSLSYAESISQEFGFPRERIIVANFGVNDRYEELRYLESPKGFHKNEYALAIGRSNRDFDFLIKAWETIDFPLIIISDTYTGTSDNKNITILTNVVGRDSEPWIVNCGLLVIPIDDGTICSGDTVLLTAMSLKRKIVATKPSTLAEMYITDGENALLAPKEPEKFRYIVMEALCSPGNEDLGNRARDSFLRNYSRERLGMNITAALKR